jgi:hypothetical protein|tara:strand:- start:225 stop:653 length:429 start_codon:yes stop_codon:yes gene_type:complete
METDTEKFISTFVESGDYLHSMREAGYTEKNVYKLKLMGQELLAQHKGDVDKRFQQRLRQGGPRALNVIQGLMDTSESDTVRLNSAKEVLDRGGYSAYNDNESGKTIEELNAQLVALVGSDGAKMLVGAFRSRKTISGPTIS